MLGRRSCDGEGGVVARAVLASCAYKNKLLIMVGGEEVFIVCFVCCSLAFLALLAFLDLVRSI